MKFQLSPSELLLATTFLSAHSQTAEIDDDEAKWRCRFIVVSDLHVCSPGFRAEEFLTFLKYVHSEQLCIDGDFIDFMMLYWYRYFPQSHLSVIQKLLRKARKGIGIAYIPGNHDKHLRKLATEALRDGSIVRLGENIILVPLLIHFTKLGQKFLILHGDEFDGQSGFSAIWEKLGSHGYNVVMWLDRRINTVLRLLHLKEWQISARCKSLVKNLIRQYSTNFNQVVAALTEKYKVDGIIYGHVHTPMDVVIDGIRVINDGAWVERPPAGCTALVEDMNGVLGLVQWREEKLFNFLTGEEISEGEIRFAPQTVVENQET